MKVYEVILQDIWCNTYQIGFFSDLNDAIKPLNEQMGHEYLSKGELVEYPSTFSMCFNVNVGDILAEKYGEEEAYKQFGEDMSYSVLGFIYDDVNELIKELESIKGK